MSKVAISAQFLTVATPASGQPPARSGGGMMRSPAFLALDTDKDGVISAAELAHPPESLKTLDQNGDGLAAPDRGRRACYIIYLLWVP